MERKRKLFLAKGAVILGAIPIILWAYEYGPDVGYSGVPTDNNGLTCANANCHTGTTNDPNNKGSVVINFPNGTTYAPGVQQHLTVTISDPATSQAAWGFQATARYASNSAVMAGSFTSDDAYTQVMCGDKLLSQYTEVSLPFGQNQVCPPSNALSFVEHTLTGYQVSRGHTGSYTFQFDWTPPENNVGNVVFYVAGNAGLNAGLPTQNGDHIYSTKYTLTPAAAGSGPTVTSVVNAAATEVTGIVPNSWVTIFGSNFTPSGFTDTWANAITNGNLPKSLDGVSVSVGGQPAYIYYVSSGQINIVAPDVGTGSMQVVVTSSTGSASAPFTVTSLTQQPAFFLWPNSYAVATHADFTWAVKNGEFSGTTTVPAKPGEYIILWGTSFGPTSPAAPTGEQLPASPLYSTPSGTPVSVTIGGQSATVYQNSATLAPGFAGLFQVIVQVPAGLANGDYPVVATINGASSPATTTMLTVHN